LKQRTTAEQIKIQGIQVLGPCVLPAIGANSPPAVVKPFQPPIIICDCSAGTRQFSHNPLMPRHGRHKGCDRGQQPQCLQLPGPEHRITDGHDSQKGRHSSAPTNVLSPLLAIRLFLPDCFSARILRRGRCRRRLLDPACGGHAVLQRGK
jgi:hypothetical protein